MRTHTLKAMILTSLALVAALLAPQRALADDDDPPSRVARLAFTSGAVSFQPAGTDDWVSAVVNRPITTGDKLWSDQDSRAELNLGSASIRMSSMTGFSFLNLTDSVTQIQLTAGTLRVRVKRLDENETFEIDTPNLAFSVLRPGVYRIDVDENGDATIIKVRGGEGEITGGGSAFDLHPGEVGTFNGTDQLTADIESYGDDAGDDFDAWCADRDRREDLSVSARYVSPDVIGYQDLDEYGGWRPVPEYGEVWFPHTTIVGWAPYRYGHWAYVAPWGYTWIDDSPWGFAPFHYGRWVNYNGVWGWVPCPPPAPGVVYVRPVYAPALVAWVGGPHFAVGIGVGGGFGAGVSVGWFPLGPREVYVPSYHVSRTYINNVNVSNTVVNTTVINNVYNTTIVNRNTTVINNNVTVIHQTYMNQRVAGAVTATTPQAFTSAQPVARNVVRIDTREIATAPVNAYTPAVPPAKQAVLGSGAVARVHPPAVLETRTVVAKVPPPPPPVSFARQRQAIEANGGRPLAISQERQIQPQTVQTAHPMVKIAPPSTPNSPRSFRGGPGNAGNRGGNPNPPNATHTGPQGPVYANRPGTPANNGQPAANTNGKMIPDRGTFNDRPSGAGGGNPNSSNATHTGPQGPVYANPSSTPANNGQPAANTTGKVIPDRGTFNDRPPSAGGGNNAGANNNPSGGNGNVVPDRRTFNDRPQGAGGNNAATGNNNGGNRGNNTALDQKQQQELEQLRAKQDQDRQRLEQQQQAQRLKLAQQAADEQKQQQLNQKHNQQLQTMEQQHDNQVQKLEQKQQQERKGTPPKGDSKSKDNQKDDHKH